VKGKSGVVHVIAEAYLSDDMQWWMVVGGQWNVTPTLDRKPLNSVEFQKTISQGSSRLTLNSFFGKKPTNKS
jgi:hypothetical protein